MILQQVAQQAGTLSLEPRDWIELIVLIFAVAGVWWKLDTKVNGFGARADDAARDATAAKAVGDKLVLELENAHNDRADLRERVATVEAMIDAVKEDLSEERLAVMTTLHNNEKAAAERDAKLREELARLTERMDIQRMIRTVVAEFAKGGNV